MKSFFKYFFAVIIVATVGGYIYWQKNKKQIVKDTLQTTIKNKTDSLYFIHYDSSEIDEINGNAIFYNVVMQSDSMQKELLKSQDSLPAVLFNIHVNAVGALGVDVPGLLTKQAVSANILYLQQPVINIIETGFEKSRQFTTIDTLALYQKILGKFKTIKADTIRVIDGNLFITDRDGNVLTSLEKININLTNFLVDSTHDYSNIVSYFVKGVKATVDEVKFPGAKQNTQVSLGNVGYDAAKKSITVQQVKQYNLKDSTTSISLENIAIDDLNTDAFIIAHQLKAGAVTCDGGVLTINIKNMKGKPTANKGDHNIELSDDFFNAAQVGVVNLNNTKIIIVNEDDPDLKPIELNNVKFNVLKKVDLYDGNTVSSLINNAEWQLSSDGFSVNLKGGIYRLNVGNFTITNTAVASIKISHVQLKPLLSETAYGLKVGKQADLYNFDFNNIVLTDVNIHSLLSENKIEVQSVSLQPFIRIFNDRTLPADIANRLGTYPNESLFKIPFAFFIRKVIVSNGLFSYREKNASSKMTGNVFFTKINSTIVNATNIPEKITANPISILDAKAMFLDKANFSTQWVFPLNTKDGEFNISGQLDSMDGKILNPTTIPLSLISIKDGQIDNIVFDVKGNDYKTSTNMSFLYKKVKLTILKKVNGTDKLKKKNFLSAVAKLVIKSDNTENKERKINALPFVRDLNTPFFYVVWTSIFTAAKQIALGHTNN